MIENQWVMTLPHGGQPIPLNQPTRKLSPAMKAMASFSWAMPIHCTGTIMKAMEMAAMMRPSGRNFLESLLSEMLAIRNLEKPYAIAFMDNTMASSSVWKPRFSSPGMAMEKFFLTI